MCIGIGLGMGIGIYMIIVVYYKWNEAPTDTNTKNVFFSSICLPLTHSLTL